MSKLRGQNLFVMSNGHDLYLLALLPNDQITSEVKELKSIFSQRFDSHRGEKVIPHITLKPPFPMSIDEVTKLVEDLIEFSHSEDPLHIHLDGFGYFLNKKSDVIFVKPVENPLLRRFQRHLIRFLAQSGLPAETPYKFNPHMTIAYRDLKREQTKKAWDLLEHQTYIREFDANEFYLLKYENGGWKKFAAFPLSPYTTITN